MDLIIMQKNKGKSDIYKDDNKDKEYFFCKTPKKERGTMKLKGKTNGYAIFLIIMCMTITISLFYFIAGTEKQMMLEKIGQGDFNKGAVHFRFDRNIASFKDIVLHFQNAKQNNFALLYDDYGSNIRQIFIKGEYDSPPIILGRFFNERDFSRNKKLAVIGKNYSTKILEENGQKYIEIENEKFQVIGIMGMEIETGLDDRIIINADALYQELQNNTIILDSSASLWGNNSVEIFDELKQLNKDSSLEALDIEPIGIGHVIKKNVNLLTLSGLMLLSYLWCSLVVAVDWIYDKNKRLSIMSLIGCSNLQIIMYIYKQYYKHVFTGLILGLLIACLFRIYVEHLEFAALVLLMISLVGGQAILVAMKKTFRIVLAERIR